jgi:hypothetical protein
MIDSDYVDSFPGSSMRLCRFVEEAAISAVTRVVLDAIDVLRSSWEPLSAEVILYAVDGSDPMTRSLVKVEQPHRLLVKASIDEGIRVDSVMIDPVVSTEDELSRRAIESWLDGTLRGAIAGDGQHGEWREIFFRACSAWVGPTGWRSGETEVRLRHEARTVVIPIKRDPSGAWLSGPRQPAFDQAPIDVRITNEDGFVTLQLTRHYGYWLEQGEPAAQRFGETIARLRAMGWDA